MRKRSDPNVLFCSIFLNMCSHFEWFMWMRRFKKQKCKEFVHPILTIGSHFSWMKHTQQLRLSMISTHFWTVLKKRWIVQANSKSTFRFRTWSRRHATIPFWPVGPMSFWSETWTKTFNLSIWKIIYIVFNFIFDSSMKIFSNF